MRRFLVAALLGALLLATPGAAQPGAPAGNAQLVDAWYQRFLGRSAELASQPHVDALNAGQDPASVLSVIVGSAEYYQRAGNTPEGFVAAAYQNMTGRRPTAAEVRFWANRLARSSATDVAYEMLRRYPEGLDGPAPVPPPPPAYEYRRPLDRHRAWEYRDWDRRPR